MYEDYYQFTGKPFQLTPDQRFFFNSKVHNRAMAYLRYGLEQGEGFIVITGGIGTGKTMLVRNLFKELENREVMAAQLVTTQVEPEDMLRMVCASFGLAHEGLNKATLLHNLEVIARARYAEGKRVLLVVDEAQNLPARSVEELRMLSNFQTEGRSLFQSFLLGQEEFKRTLQKPGMEQVRQRIIASYHLEPLSREESRRYIEFRLGLVGWKGDPAFTDGVFEALHEIAAGVPRRINTVCDRLLLFSCMEELHTIDRHAVATVRADMESEMGQPEAVDDAPPARTQRRAEAASPSAASSKDSWVPHPELNEPARGKRAKSAQFRGEEKPEATEGDLLRRLELLEEEVFLLKKGFQQERKLLRKAILLHLDMGEEADERD